MKDVGSSLVRLIFLIILGGHVLDIVQVKLAPAMRMIVVLCLLLSLEIGCKEVGSFLCAI